MSIASDFSTQASTCAGELGGDVVVLLVDDQPMVAYTIEQMLQTESDIRLHFCQDPARAIATANDVRPTIILQDLTMPNVSGLTLLKEFRTNLSTRETPLMVLSVKEEPTTKAKAFALGANDYLIKPPERIELITRIRYHSRGYVAQMQRNDAYRKLAESERKFAEEVAQAADYVRSLFPAPLDRGPVHLDWRFVPSTQLAGDAFGYHWLDNKNLAIYQLDVSGHGIGPSLLAISVLNVLAHGSLAGTDFRDPSAVLQGLNAMYQMESHGGLFFTIWYGIYNIQDQQLTFSAGGHPPPFLLDPPASRPAKLRALMATGPPIGCSDFSAFENSTIRVLNDARLLLYSDGAVEIEQVDGHFASQREFTDFVGAVGWRDELMELILQRARTMRGKSDLNDDCSLVQVDFPVGHINSTAKYPGVGS